jgi:hypothetical protein
MGTPIYLKGYDVGDSVQMGKTLLNKHCSFNEVDFAVGPKFAMLK